MAQGKRFFYDVKKEIECPVCQKQVSETKDPKILKCFHTFCFSVWKVGWGKAVKSWVARIVDKSPNARTTTSAARHSTCFTSRWWTSWRLTVETADKKIHLTAETATKESRWSSIVRNATASCAKIALGDIKSGKFRVVITLKKLETLSQAMPRITLGGWTSVSNTTMKWGFTVNSAWHAFVVTTPYWITKITRKFPWKKDLKRRNQLWRLNWE